MICVLAAGALRLWGAAALPLSGDEAYHWEWSRHLAGAYYDHPGMTAWLIAASTALLPGAGELAVRLPAMLCALTTTLIAFGLARDLAGGRGASAAVATRAGVLAAALAFFVPLPAGLSIYMSTDPPLLPCWLGAVWALFAALERGRTRAWLLCGLCVGLAAATKLLSLLLLGSIAAFLIGTRFGRAWLRRPQPWLALGVAVLAAAPMLVWNATHDWMTFRFNFAIRQREQEASLWHPLAFVGGQLAILTPGFAVLAWLATTARAARARPALLAVVVCALVPLMFLLAVTLRRKVGVHWSAAPWQVSLTLLAVAWALREPWTQRRLARWAWHSSCALTVVGLLAAQAFSTVADQVARIEWFAGQPKRVLRNLYGWQQAGAAATAAAEELRARPDARGVFLLSNQYGTAAALAFYAPTQPRVHLWSPPRNHGCSYAAWDEWETLRGQNAVYIVKRALAEFELPVLRAHFAAVSEVERVPILRDGEERNAFFLVRCFGFDGREPFAPAP